jgi:twitching motility protein PilI
MVNDYFCGQLRQSVNTLFPLSSVQEVISLTYGEICSVPGVSDALVGVVNQRGKLLWVLDLSDLLQIAPDNKNRRSQDKLTLLVLSNNAKSEQQVGCVVSVLKGIIPLDLSSQSLSSNSSLLWKSLGVSSITFDGESYALIDVQAILINIYSLYNNNLVTNI